MLISQTITIFSEEVHHEEAHLPNETCIIHNTEIRINYGRKRYKQFKLMYKMTFNDTYIKITRNILHIIESYKLFFHFPHVIRMNN